MASQHSAQEQPSWPVVLLHNMDSSWTAEEAREVERHVSTMAEALRSQGHSVETVPVRRDIGGKLLKFDAQHHVVFNWCEGLDGIPNSYHLIPPALEQLTFAYTGSTARTLQMTQSKVATKLILERMCIPTPRWSAYAGPDDVEKWTVFPAIVKPAGEHCSFGITDGAVVTNRHQLRERVAYVTQTYGGQALVEDFIDGREFNISIWGNGQPVPLPLYEIDFSGIPDHLHRLVDYDAKWTIGSFAYEHTVSRCPAQVEQAVAQRILGAAMAAYKALELRDYGRIDIRVCDGQPYVLDVNSNPDITSDGGFARTAAVAGYDYGTMASHIVSLAAHRLPLPT